MNARKYTNNDTMPLEKSIYMDFLIKIAARKIAEIV